MSAAATYPFNELKAELIEHILDMGQAYFTGTLDAVPVEASGGLVSAKQRHPGEWVACDGDGMIEVTMYPEEESQTPK